MEITERAVEVMYGQARHSIDCVPSTVADELIHRMWAEVGPTLISWYPDRSCWLYRALLHEAMRQDHQREERDDG